MIILKGGRYRAVLTANPVNFPLLSDEEQNGIEDAFGNLLMGLRFRCRYSSSLFRWICGMCWKI